MLGYITNFTSGFFFTDFKTIPDIMATKENKALIFTSIALASYVTQWLQIHTRFYCLYNTYPLLFGSGVFSIGINIYN